MRAGLLVLLLTVLPLEGRAYSVLTHEAIVDTLWVDTIQPLLKKRFPTITEEELTTAHGYAYGGCIIQDLGYYPFGNHFFSDLVHYVRSADFVRALLAQASDADEYAFALGAVAHYGGDVDGHSIAVNRSVPLLFPKLRRKYGDVITYADSPSAHLKTEFGIDVLQVARGNYAPKAYHDFIGFQVSKDLLNRAFKQTYGLKLKDLFLTLDLALGTYRFTVSNLIPDMTKAAWALKKNEIMKSRPGIVRKQFLYNINRASYRKEWGTTYERPGWFTRLLAFLSRVLPRVGPFKSFGFKTPTPQTEKMFEDSFDASVTLDRQSFAEARQGEFRMSNRDLDTGKLVTEGEYTYTDKTYDKLLVKLAEKKFAGVTSELRANILSFYERMPSPDSHGIGAQLEALRAYTPAGT